MIVTLMIYCFSVAALVSVAAFAIERAAAILGWPRRVVWIVALVTSLYLPLLMIVMGGRDVAQTMTAVFVPTAFDSTPMETLPIAQAPAFSPALSDDLIADLLKGTWVISSIGLLLFMLVGWIRLRFAARHWQSEMIDGVRVRVTENLGPAVVGFVIPEIVVPRWLLDAQVADRSAALAHERAHVAAADTFVLFVALLLVAVMPWNLPLWWQLRRLRFAIEVDCDQRVLSGGTSIASYGEMLLAVGQKNSRIPLGAMAMIQPVSQLERRIRIMTTGAYRYSKLVIVATFALSASVMAAATQLNAPPLSAIAPDLFAAKGLAVRATSEMPKTEIPAPTQSSNGALKSTAAPVIKVSLADSAQISVSKPARQSVPVRKTVVAQSDPGVSRERINLDFVDVDVRAILNTLSDISGQNIVVSDKVSGKKTYRLNYVPWDQALNFICTDAGLVARMKGQVIFIEPATDERGFAPALGAAQVKPKLPAVVSREDWVPTQGAKGEFTYTADRVELGGPFMILENAVAKRSDDEKVELFTARRAEVHGTVEERQSLVLYDGTHYISGRDGENLRQDFERLVLPVAKKWAFRAAAVSYVKAADATENLQSTATKTDSPPISPAAVNRPVKRTLYVAPVRPQGIPQDGVVHWVEVSFTITTNGTVQDAEVYKSQPDDLLNDAALTAVRQWLYEPEIKDGVAVSSRTIIRIRF